MKQLLATMFLLTLPMTASAALYDRGAGLIYDDVLNVTWMADANYAKTSGYDEDGKLSLVSAVSWVDQLVYHDDIRNVDYDDWRMPQNTGEVMPFHYGWWYLTGDPSPQDGPHTELSYMYYENLSLKGYNSNYGNWGTDFGIHGDSTFGGQESIGLVTNLQGDEYWLDYTNGWDSRNWTFNTNSGNHFVRESSYYVWAVRDGDVLSAVPVPAAFWLFGSALLGLGALKRKRT